MTAEDTGIPAEIGPYRIAELLGKGGMGVVYRGISPAGEQVAVKQIRAVDFDAEERARFAVEMEALRTVFGSRTASFVEGDAEAEQPWLAMEYIPGATLRAWVADHGPLEPAMVAIMGAVLAEGLVSIHQADLLHRDLKPHNIVLAADGPKVIDFGLALLNAEKVARIEDPARISRTGRVVGTLVCMAPEQVRQSSLTTAADVFGLGATLLYAATGHYPFTNADSEYALIRKIESPGEHPDLSGLAADLVAPLTAMLAHEPEDRPALKVACDLLLAVVEKTGLSPLEARERLRRITAAGVARQAEPEDGLTPTPKPKREASVAVSHSELPAGAVLAADRLRTAYARGRRCNRVLGPLRLVTFPGLGRWQ
ncbi:serine/threonine protein kinase [Amycolatopsis sp. NBC_00345]|uniref:serine/threonine-protein kinase n=1 Tax=Amycolatopsis sp. NBC_00345 TaxID=2975955 RepID=UPI002E26DA9F